MALAARLEQYLSEQGLSYRELAIEPVPNLDAAVIASGRSQHDFVQATLLLDIDGVVMAVHRFDSALDIPAVQQLTGRRLQPLTARQSKRLFEDCEPGFVPPVGGAYRVPVLVDEDVINGQPVLFSGGRNDALVEIDGETLKILLADAFRARLVIHGQGGSDRGALTLDEVAGKLRNIYRLPPMPALAPQIRSMATSEGAVAEDLADVIELDPSLTAQILRYARSGLFETSGETETVRQAVTRVLGVDRVAHIVQGSALVGGFGIPRDGILGMQAFWSHALYCGFLCQRIAPRCGVDRDMAYLCGLLHNFGLLLLGYLFPAEFEELSRLRESNPEASMKALEQQVFGHGDEEGELAVGHGAIGGLFHRFWQLPEPVIKAAGMHQYQGYTGEHETYVLIVQLANGLLKSRGIGDEFNEDNVPVLLASLGLRQDAVYDFEKDIDSLSPDLDALTSSRPS
ncbi:HDOD domain-containing protein [Marinobacter pelagius]|uniref:HD-like signal output (HDOD) domain, no enzymatic activity n=1 Tax=Marinobacter pelagius TaxID=379482 RepID=A0A1I4Y3P5_9GAMM|nr:HDOD domain-containing protein [Marinobacter pelagius]SFN32615.1 HD-like signal output (HDOD) domain, no enzymatic activity [Marinobacter pelagius]